MDKIKAKIVKRQGGYKPQLLVCYDGNRKHTYTHECPPFVYQEDAQKFAEKWREETIEVGYVT